MASILYLFISNLFSHAFAWIGAVLTVIGVIEKLTNKTIAISPKWVVVLGAVFLSIGSFQAWRDEHNNTQAVIEQRRQAEIDKGVLQGKLDDKQSRIEYLEAHQTFQASINMPKSSPHTHLFFLPGQLATSVEPPFTKGMKPGIDISFGNSGDFTITNPEQRAIFVVVPLLKINDVFKQYQSEILASRIINGGDIPAHLAETQYHTFYSSELTDAHVANLNNQKSSDPKKEALCGLGFVRWNDDSGSYQTNYGQCYYNDSVGGWHWLALIENNHETKLRSK